MPATISKADVLRAVEALPEETFELEDVIERLVVLHKVRTALAEEEPPISHAKVMAEFEKPRGERMWSQSRD